MVFWPKVAGTVALGGIAIAIGSSAAAQPPAPRPPAPPKAAGKAEPPVAKAPAKQPKAAEPKAPAKAPAAPKPAAPKAAAKAPAAPKPAEPAAPPKPAGDETPPTGPATAPPPSPAEPPLLPPPTTPLTAPPTEPKPTTAAGAASAPAPAAAGTAAVAPPAPKPAEPLKIDKDKDKDKPKERPQTELLGPKSEIYAEEWWKLSRPTFELHGYFRVRNELFHNFDLGRVDAQNSIWPQPPDQHYIDTNGQRHRVELCGDDPTALGGCDSGTQMGANLRFRLEPDLHISDNLRIRSQIDLLDNLVLGSTPEGYANQPGRDGGYVTVARGGYAPTGAFVTTQWAPVGGVNSLKDSVMVKRVWGEYATPIGQLRFGRMPSHWGLGMLVNSGDGYDSDYQSTADRLMFVTGIKSWDLYFAGLLDFTNEGAISQNLLEQQGQPYDLAQEDDVDQYTIVIVRKRNEHLQKRELAEGLPVFNGGLYFVYRNQRVANDVVGPGASLVESHNDVRAEQVRQQYQFRGAEAVIPDIWFQFLYKKFRFELEAAMIWGSLDSTLINAGTAVNYNNPDPAGDDGWNIRQFGMATQTEFRAVEDKLKLQFDFGYASGDDDVDSLVPVGQLLQPQRTADRTYSTFRFHPDYRVDLILFRHILSRVQGAYYFKPSVSYDFLRDPDGQKLGGGVGIIWSRAAEFVQTPGNARDLGIELDFKLYFQARDGVLNDDPSKMGGFYAQLEYGVLFPLGGFDYLPGEIDDYAAFQDPDDEPLDTQIAQTARLYLGILF